MKSLVTTIVVFTFGIFNVFSQEIPNKVFDIKVVDSIINDTTISKKLTEINNIKDEYWDNTVYNPYKDLNVRFPIKLSFEDSIYTSPITINKVVTSRYGWRWGRAHQGIDIDLITGDSVVAMFDGIVRFARYNPGHGRTVIVRHYNGLETVYAHLSRYNVKENDSVKSGQLLGKGGRSGNARGSHLHLVVNYKGVSINPEYIFDFSEENKIRAKELWVTKTWTKPYRHSSKRQSKLDLFITKEEALASTARESKIYVVKRGDTLSKISRRNNVAIASICKANNISRNSIIKIGQKLVIQ